ncbi:MAG: hypothetical protein ACK4SO_06030, partial [Candidatus Kapaibacteriota bacterium]
EYRIPIISYQSDKKFFETVVKEISEIYKSLKELEFEDSFPDVPLYVVTHDSNVMENLSIQIGIPQSEAKRIEEFWLEEQRELASQAPLGKLLIAENSDRNIHYSNPIFLLHTINQMIIDIRHRS